MARLSIQLGVEGAADVTRALQGLAATQKQVMGAMRDAQGRFLAGAKAGLLLTIALTLEILFLGVTVTEELGANVRSKIKIVAITGGLGLLLPLGVVLATPVASFPLAVIDGFLSFGLIALLYLVTEELLVEAHAKPDSPLISAMFFVGFLGLLLLEELMG